MPDSPIADPLAWRSVKTPSLADLEILAREVFARLPAKFRALCEGLVIQVEDFAPDEVLDDMGIESEFRQGMRVTDERVMNVVEMVLGELNQEIVGLINQHGGRAVGLTGQDGAFIHARKMLLKSQTDHGEPVDIGLVGEVEAILGSLRQHGNCLRFLLRIELLMPNGSPPR